MGETIKIRISEKSEAYLPRVIEAARKIEAEIESGAESTEENGVFYIKMIADELGISRELVIQIIREVLESADINENTK